MSALTKKIASGRPRSFIDKASPLGPIIHEIQDKVDVHDGLQEAWPTNGVVPTVATSAGTTEILVHVPFAGKLTGAKVVFKDALAASDTDYVTFAIKNKSNASVDMLSTAAVNTTKTTGGTALSAYTSRALTLNGTAANLNVAAGDVLAIQVNATAATALANTLTEGSVQLKFDCIP